MERAELRFERWQVWVAVLTLALGGAAWGVQIGVSAGQLTARVEAVETTGVLDQGSLPRDRQREEKCVEPRVVEALADVAPGREH